MTFHRFANSLGTRIIFIGICLLLVGNVLRYMTLSSYLREDISAVMAAQQLTLANYVAREVDQKLLERQALLTQAAASLPLGLLERPAALQSWLAVRQQYQPLFSHGLIAYTPDGKAVAGSAAPTTKPLPSYADADLFQAVQSGALTVGRPIRNTTTQEAVLPMAIPVKDASGKVRAVLMGVTALATPGFLSFTDQDRIGKQGGFLLISPRDKLFIASTVPGMVLKPTPPPGVNALHDRAMQGYRGTGTTVNAFGVEEISAMASVPSTGWFVVARLPTTEALSVVARTKRYMTLHGSWALFAFVAIASILLYYALRPLLQAAQQADRMTRGEVPLEPLVVARQDEVGHLTEAFNRLLVKLQASQSEMVHMAHHDVLTGLPNRALLADRLAQALARAHRRGSHVAFLCIDLDHFKPINDQLGHAAGDQALVEVARRLNAVVRESDTLARIGGDEFAVLLADLDADPATAEQAATAVAAKCLAAIAPPIALDAQTRILGASIGIAMGDSTVSPHPLQLAADRAMYRAKNAGGQRYLVATSL
ncbi:diguanylate cyclase domain-containing protein [Rhodoferax saidenbachensis]|uniref:Diguanylate cyclase (GGDEF)-like protein n=1 Tax=Rhodoferax saidenbachensis TaxID=1484693 RepID=A0ABU1ZM80_9BURK|nr:diguanylate cyclase [Rhodoferax saidenbachensis]MDR7306593.1 diguanylate cyclase (GGDEF)-like protein [Rhodoferax saidenbachensis]